MPKRTKRAAPGDPRTDLERLRVWRHGARGRPADAVLQIAELLRGRLLDPANRTANDLKTWPGGPRPTLRIDERALGRVPSEALRAIAAALEPFIDEHLERDRPDLAALAQSAAAREWEGRAEAERTSARRAVVRGDLDTAIAAMAAAAGSYGHAAASYAEHDRFKARQPQVGTTRPRKLPGDVSRMLAEIKAWLQKRRPEYRNCAPDGRHDFACELVDAVRFHEAREGCPPRTDPVTVARALWPAGTALRVDAAPVFVVAHVYEVSPATVTEARKDENRRNRG